MPSKKTIFYLAIIILLAIAVAPRFNQLMLGLKYAKDADLTWVMYAALSLAGTYFTAAFIYKLLAKHPINYLITCAVQLASSFANRILPVGIGGISLNIDYLIKNKHKAAESTSVVAMSSLVAFVSHILLLLSALIISRATYETILEGKNLPFWLPFVVAALILAAAFIIYTHRDIKRKITDFVKDAWQNFLNYHDKPLRLIFSLIGASLITAFYVFAFYACAHSAGLPITAVQAFLVYTLGTVLGVATLTPGGLGGVEAGLVAGLVAFRAEYSVAFTAVIIYRLVTFWLPIIPGYLAFWLLQRNKLI
jgi:undecaprenyl-diphosphatase